MNETQAVSERIGRPRSGRSGKALLLTILGEFVLPNGGSVWTSTLIETLGLLGVSEPNARQAAARLRDDGILMPVKIGRSTRWDLTPRGQRLLSAGAQRIYEFGSGDQEWDGRWILVLTSIPEDVREKRHQVRSQLEFAGYGFLSAGVAVSPHAEREKETQTILEVLDLDPRPLVFTASTVAFLPDREVIGRAWDLDALSGKYRVFLDEFGRVRPTTGTACFESLVMLVHEWRRFPFEDPEIPLELLPAKWPGTQSKQLFDNRRALWSAAAQDWYRSLESMLT
jgi:phenylacetic acid degradation operon negative regulatory protein